MASYSCAAAEHLTHEIALVGQSGERFLAAQASLIEAAQKAVSPFDLNLSSSRQSIQIDGDKVAVMIAERLLKPLCEKPSPQPMVACSQKEFLEKVVAEILNREFGLRLSGLLRPLQPRSISQVAFLRSLLSWSDQIVVGIGPTGTGKTHAALAAGLNQLAEDRVKHVVVTRPHVVMEGEVVTPVVRRELEYDDQFEYLEDIICDLVGNLAFRNLVAERKLALMPLGHFRGRTFNDCFIVVDDAENLTVGKMRMVTTKIGRASRMVLIGNPQAHDFKVGEQSGLLHLLELVRGTDIARVHKFAAHEVIRNSIVSRLEQLYSMNDSALTTNS